METVTIDVPAELVQGLDQDKLREALVLGLTQMRQQSAEHRVNTRMLEVLIGTRRVRHWSEVPSEASTTPYQRQPPPTLPDPSVSDTIIAQRRGACRGRPQ